MHPTIQTTSIEGLLVINREVHPDERGSFQEIWRTDEISDVIGRPVTVVQGNLSMSKAKTLRGLHAEEMDKLVTPLTGLVFCAAVDLREDSPTFGKHETFTIDNRVQPKSRTTIFLPDGVANSFCVVGDEDILYLYAVSATYADRPTRTVLYSDPDLNIQWPLSEDELIISDDDRANKTMREHFPHKFKDTQ